MSVRVPTVYSWPSNTVLIAAEEVTGLANGDDVVTFKRLQPVASHRSGIDGQTVISVNAARDGECALKLLQTSPLNKFLMDWLNVSQIGGPELFKVLPITWVDHNRQDVGGAVSAWIEEMPEIKRGAKDNVVEWKLITNDLMIALGNPAIMQLASAVASAVGA